MAIPGINVALSLTAGGFLGGINKAVGGLKKMVKAMSFAGKAATGFGLAVVAIGAIHITKSIQEFVKFEQQLAGLAKVMNDFGAARAVALQVGELSRVMPVASEAMFQVAETAARLGIRGTKNIVEFTKVATMMGVATDLSADVAADAFARILKQTRTPIREFGALAAVVNELSNNMATTSSEIVDSVRRSAPELARLGFTAPQIAALAASLNEVSESASRAGTRLRRLAQDLGDPRKAGAFAEAIGEVPGEFKKLLAADPVGTLQRIIKVFGEGGVAAQKLSTKIDSRVRLALAALSQNAEGTTLALKLMAEQLAGPDSLIKEFKVFDNTVASTSIRLQNSIDQLQRATGAKIIVMKRNWEELKLAIVNALIPDIDPLDGIAKTTKIANEFRTRIEDELASARGQESNRLESSFSRSGSLIVTPQDRKNFQDIRNASKEMNAFVNYGLNELGVTAEASFQILDLLLIPAMQSAGDTASVAQKKVAGIDFAAGLIKNMGALEDVLTGASTAVEEFAGEELLDIAAVATALKLMSDEGDLSASDWDVINSMFDFLAVKTNKMRAGEEATTQAKLYSAAAEDFKQKNKEIVAGIKGGEVAAFKLTDVYINMGDGIHEVSKEQQLLLDSLLSVTRAEEEQAASQALKERIENYREGTRALQEQVIMFNTRGEAEAREVTRTLAMANAWMEATTQLGHLGMFLGANRIAVMLDTNAAEDNQLAWEKRQKALEDADEAEAKRLEKLQKRIEDLQLHTLESQFDLLVGTLEQVADSAVTAFDSIITGSGNAGEAVIQMIRDIAKELMKRQITAFLLQTFANSGSFKVGAGGGAKAMTEADVLKGPGIKQFASGGSMNAGQLSVVGEKGAELFVPRTAGTVVPNDKLGGLGNSETFVINNHFTIQAMDGASVRNALISEKKTIQGITMGGIGKSRALKKAGVR